MFLKCLVSPWAVNLLSVFVSSQNQLASSEQGLATKSFVHCDWVKIPAASMRGYSCDDWKNA